MIDFFISKYLIRQVLRSKENQLITHKAEICIFSACNNNTASCMV